MSLDPLLSVIIPSLDGDRGGSLARLEAAIKTQSYTHHELMVVVGVSPQGRAINQGVSRARGEVLVILDDDAAIDDPELFSRLVLALASDPTIGMAGASVRTPASAGLFQRLAAREFPRFNVPVVSKLTDSDLACHGCAAFPRAAFEGVGGEREEIVRGLDPDLRQRLRRAGYRVVLVPDAVIYHPLPATLRRLLKTFYRNGSGSAYAQVFHPELVYDTDERLERREALAHQPFAWRLVRFPFRLVWAVVSLRPLRALAYLAYAAGFAASYPLYILRRRRRRSSSTSS